MIGASKGQPKTRRNRKRDRLYDEPRRPALDRPLVVGEGNEAGVLAFTVLCKSPAIGTQRETPFWLRSDIQEHDDTRKWLIKSSGVI